MNAVHFTIRSMPNPAAARVPLMFSSTCRVSAWMPPGTSVPPARRD